MLDWLNGIRSALPLSGRDVLWGVTIFLASTLGGLALAGLIVVRLPETYFCGPRERRDHPGMRGIAMRAARNVAGVLLVVLGLILSLPGVPGPGLLIVLLGIGLTDTPAKHRLERWLVGRPGVLATINKLRTRYGKPPMALNGERKG